MSPLAERQVDPTARTRSGRTTPPAPSGVLPC